MSTFAFKTRGFSLIEIMVGLVIGMLAMIVIMQVFAVFEEPKRRTTSISDVQQSGQIALMTLERGVQMGGQGFSFLPALGCPTLRYDNAAIPPGPISPRIAPVLITDGGGGLPDRLLVMFGTGGTAFINPFGMASTGTNNIVLEQPTVGFNNGDMVLIVQPAPPVVNCTLAQVTELLPDKTITRIQGNGTGPCPDPVPTNPCTGSRYNRAGGLGQDYNANAQLVNLGRLASNEYYVLGNNLVVTSDSTGAVSAVASPLAAGVVGIQAQYGIDIDADGDIDNWVQPTGAFANNPVLLTPTPANLDTIVAVRVAILMRSEYQERQASGVCTTTTIGSLPQPSWAPAANFDVTALADWGCYRYKLFSTVVPLRNMIWRFPLDL